jgi:GT2 family glycosyltransferase
MPDVAVAVVSHARPLRLRWLLNALEEQTLDPARFEVVVVHDSAEDETPRLLAEHPLGASGRLRALPVAPGSASLAALRNLGWRAAGSPLVAFTDDDCRPRPDWLERLLAVGAGRPGAVVQGRTRPDPDELGPLRGAPWARSMDVEPPTAWGETCNIAYPAALLEALDGFDESLPGPAGEDADLAARARAGGAAVVAAPDAVVHHAVHTPWLGARLRAGWRWEQLAAVIARHPELRRELPGRIWWKPEHAALALAATGAALARRERRRRRPAAPLRRRRRRPLIAAARLRREPGPVAGRLRRALPVALAVPWLALALRHRGHDPRGLARSAIELPGRALLDAGEVAALAWGSARHRTLVL